jgi:diguanylate cyclase (GGDEF)-like protein/PAS domain S-box-containing protein
MGGPVDHLLLVGGTETPRLQQLLNATSYSLVRAPTVDSALERLAVGGISAVLLAVEHPSETVISDLSKLAPVAPAMPVFVITTSTSELFERAVVDAGGRDVLLESQLDGYWFPRMILHAINDSYSDHTVLAETERFGITLELVGEGLLTTDTANQVTYLNRTAETMTGWKRSEASGQPLSDVLQLIDSTTRQRATEPVQWVSPAGPNPIAFSHWLLLSRDGAESAIEHSTTALTGRHGRISGSQIVLRDISAIREMAIRMSHIASHDALTELPNRLLLDDRLGRAIVSAKRHNQRLAVLFVDIDYFKAVNDSLGHLVGDELLRSIARALSASVRSSDTVSRYGGDEFVVVLSELGDVNDAATGAATIIAAVSRPHRVSGHELHVTTSIGISVFPDDGENPETLLTRADTAMYQAKQEGRNGYQFFAPRLSALAANRLATEAGLRRALRNDEFRLLYQPQVNLHNGRIVGVEALLRWHHPERGLLEPYDFLATAEDAGLITPIGGWVVDEACRQMRKWMDAGLRAVPVAVNVSAAQFRRGDLVAQVTDALADNSIDPGLLELELTESAMLTHTDAAAAIMHRLKEVGVHLTVDDFGTGWSSFTYLRQFPIDALKIHNSFVHEITTNRKAALIVSAVIKLGKSFAHRVIAEGIETEEQLAFLRSEECDEGQGYLFSRPVAAHELTGLLGESAVD